MGFPDRLITWETTSEPPVRVGERVLVPESQTVSLRLPLGGLVWRRPVAVTVQQDDRTERIPIRDVTGWIQLGLAAMVALTATMALLRKRRRGNV